MGAPSHSPESRRQFKAWLRRLSGRGLTRDEELRSYDVFLAAANVVVIGTWITMTVLGRFPLVAHVFSGLWIGLQLFVRWRRRNPLQLPPDESP